MQARLVADPGEFLAAAEPLLLADEARHNVILGLARTLVERPSHYPEHRLYLVEDGGTVVGAALRTPPHHLAVARPAAGGALDALAEAIDAPGAARAAAETDLDLLAAWWRGFLAEVSHDPPTDVETSIRLRLDAPGWGIDLWEDDGRPVSFAAFGNPTPSGARVGPVYTPPELRGRGYAGAVVAHVSQRLLDAGRRFCFLYADQANPTANGIYRRIGYEQVAEAANVGFA